MKRAPNLTALVMHVFDASHPLFFFFFVSWPCRILSFFHDSVLVADLKLLNMSIWDSDDLGDISVKVSWALFGPAFRKYSKQFPFRVRTL